MRFLYFAIFALFCTSISVGAFDLFGPRNYDQCVRKGLKDVNTNLQLKMLANVCRKEFGDKRDKKIFSTKLTECGIPRPFYNYWLPINHAKTKGIVSRLTAQQMSDMNSRGRLIELSFQNRNDFKIQRVRVGFFEDGKVCSEYDVALEFIAPYDIEAGTFGSVLNTNQAWIYKKYKNYCILTVQPPEVFDEAMLYGFLRGNGYCN